MSEGYIGDPVKRQAREDKYRRMYKHYLKTGKVMERTARYFGTDHHTVRRAVKFCEGKANNAI